MSATENQAVFLSYASQDAEAARRICDALRGAGVEVWFDQSELRGGDAWDAKIRKQIKECALFVPVISANTQARLEGYFRLEWKLAAQRTHTMADAKPFLVPVCIDDTPDAEAHVPEEFRAVQWTRLAIEQMRPGAVAVPAFCVRVRSLLSAPPQPVASPATWNRPTLRAGSDEPRAEKSIAVLAFANLSRDPENEFFSDGISDEVSNVLGKVPGLSVAARTSAFYFKGRNAPIAEIAKTLNVAYVVEGTVQRLGSRVKIGAQLVKAADGFKLWGDSFTRELADAFAIEEEIAGIIARNLQLKLGDAPKVVRTVNPEAHRLVLEGRHFWVLRTNEAFARAESAYTRSLALDPQFAEAHAGLANVYTVRGWYDTLEGKDVVTDFARAREHAERALAIDPQMAEPWAALGALEFNLWRFPEAEQAFQTALRLNPNYSYAHHWRAHLLMVRGRLEESLAELERAAQLDPLSMSTLVIYSLHLQFAGRYAEALEMTDRALAFTPYAFAPLAASRAFSLLKVGRKDEALAAARAVARDVTIKPRWWNDALVIGVLRETGHEQEAEDFATRLFATMESTSRARTVILVALGRTDESLKENAQPGASAFGYLYYHESAEAVRQHPRWQEFLAKYASAADYETAQATWTRMQRQSSANR